MATAAPTPPNRLGLSDAGALAAAEGIMTSLRISELVLEPVQGSFDAAHLMSVHHHIMQDLYEHAGQFRHAGRNAKLRGLSDGSSYRVDYSAKEDLCSQIDLALATAADSLRVIMARHGGPVGDDLAAEVSDRLASIYSDLDYVHPFQEGNSRTLRSFFSQMVLETTGMKLCWAPAQAEPPELATARDGLYMARDKAILPRSMNDATSEKTLFQLSRSMDRVKNEPGLAAVMLAGLGTAATNSDSEVDADASADQPDHEQDGAQRYERCRC